MPFSEFTPGSCCGQDSCPATSLHVDGGNWDGWTDPPASGNTVNSATETSISHSKASGNWTVDMEIKSINSSDGSRIRIGSACLPVYDSGDDMIIKVGEDCHEYGIPREEPFWIRVIADGSPVSRARSRSITLWNGDPADDASARFTNVVGAESQSVAEQRTRLIFESAPYWTASGTIGAGMSEGYEVAGTLRMPLPTPIGGLRYYKVILHLYGRSIETDGGVGVSVGVSDLYDTTMANHDPLTDGFESPGTTVTLGSPSWSGTPDIEVGGTDAWHEIDLTAIVAETIASAPSKVSPNLFVLIRMLGTDASEVLEDAENSRLEFAGLFDTNPAFLELSYIKTAGDVHCFRPFMAGPITDLDIEIEAGDEDVEIGQINVRDTSTDSTSCPSVTCPTPGACVDNTSTATIVLTAARIIYSGVPDEWMEHQHVGQRKNYLGVAVAGTGGKRLELNTSELNGTYPAALHAGNEFGPSGAALSPTEQAAVIAAALNGCDFCDAVYWWKLPTVDLSTVLTLTESDNGVAFSAWNASIETNTLELMNGTRDWIVGSHRPHLWTRSTASGAHREYIGFSLAHVQLLGNLDGTPADPVNLGAYYPLKVCSVPSSSNTATRAWSTYTESNIDPVITPYDVEVTGSGGYDNKYWEFDSVVL
ncbi:hypothetical protein [uncultured Maricaulis sp.]|uniref:hypothetical protein n=1 Tax=uncultured Maricaulis sp. TaxID=174710 RepID=UPI0030D832E4|tara:strand:- start:1511 stop:3460 length:1950 start_codon:yes stop_codon:yes gene_type:complete